MVAAVISDKNFMISEKSQRQNTERLVIGVATTTQMLASIWLNKTQKHRTYSQQHNINQGGHRGGLNLLYYY